MRRDPPVGQKTRAYLVGAFDRFNYGDILFPLVLEALIKDWNPEVEVRFVGLRGGDERARGGVLSEPTSSLYRGDAASGMRRVHILVGGELLGTDWTHMASHLYPKSMSRVVHWVSKWHGRGLSNDIWRRIHGARNLSPWILDPAELGQDGASVVVYNSVGGSRLLSSTPKEKAWQKAALSRAAWVSTRDENTANAVAEAGLPRPPVMPDSAVAMNAVAPDAELAALRRDYLARKGMGDKPYVLLQMAERHHAADREGWNRAFRQVREKTGLAFLAIPLATARGHDDQQTVDHLAAAFRDEDWFMTGGSDLTVKQIMALISGAACYAGTSLHGFITAFSYERPRLGLKGVSDLSKVKGFRDAFDEPAFPVNVSQAELPDVIHRLAGRSGASDIERVRAMYLDGFARMMEAAGITRGARIAGSTNEVEHA